MPGFFVTTADDWWSYGFVWWLSDKTPIDEAALTTALTSYFRGLSTSVGGTMFSFDPNHFKTTLSPGGPSDGQSGTTYQGQVDTYDAFTTGAPLVLHVRAHVFSCPAADRQVMLLAASPADDGTSTWAQLSQLLTSFQCP